MLPKRERLTAEEVRLVLSEGRSIRGGAFCSLKTYKNKEKSAAAVVVSKKVAKSAVVRNALRRAVYASLPPLPKNTLVVVFVQKKPIEDFARVFELELKPLFATL